MQQRFEFMFHNRKEAMKLHNCTLLLNLEAKGIAHKHLKHYILAVFCDACRVAIRKRNKTSTVTPKPSLPSTLIGGDIFRPPGSENFRYQSHFNKSAAFCNLNDYSVYGREWLWCYRLSHVPIEDCVLRRKDGVQMCHREGNSLVWHQTLKICI